MCWTLWAPCLGRFMSEVPAVVCLFQTAPALTLPASCFPRSCCLFGGFLPSLGCGPPHEGAGRHVCGFSTGLKGPLVAPSPPFSPITGPASPPQNPRVTSSSLGPEPCSWARGHVGRQTPDAATPSSEGAEGGAVSSRARLSFKERPGVKVQSGVRPSGLGPLDARPAEGPLHWAGDSSSVCGLRRRSSWTGDQGHPAVVSICGVTPERFSQTQRRIQTLLN